MVLNEKKIQKRIAKRGKKIIKSTRRIVRMQIKDLPKAVGLDKKVGVKF